MYKLVGAVDGLPHGREPSKAYPPLSTPKKVELSSDPSSSTSNDSTASALPSYSGSKSGPSDVEWLRGSVQSERRIANSHNPNPDGGVSRLDDDFTHNLPDFGTCRIQVRVNEVHKDVRLAWLMMTVVYRLLFSTSLHMSGSLSLGHTVRCACEARRDHHHHTSIYRQVDDHQGVIHHYRKRRNTSTFVILSRNQFSCSLARYTGRRWGPWRFSDRSVGEIARLRVFATLHTSWHVHAQVS